MTQPCAVPDHLGVFRITSYVITLMNGLIIVQIVKRLSTHASEMRESFRVHYTIGAATLDCSQPSIFSYFYLNVESTDKMARELDASTKKKT